MDEHEQKADATAGNRHPVLWTCVSIFLGIYFFFPALFIYPFFRIYGYAWYTAPGMKVVVVFFLPLILLGFKFPAYGALLLWGFTYLGINIPSP
jgi:hypothetical protein